MKRAAKLKFGLLAVSLACAAGATAALIILQKKREEEVYHEAELKAMDELEEMMRADAEGEPEGESAYSETEDVEEDEEPEEPKDAESAENPVEA